MSSINNTIAGLELAQIGWVVPCGRQRSGPPDCTDGLLRHLPNTGRYHADYGHHAGRMDRHRTNAEGPVISIA